MEHKHIIASIAVLALLIVGMFIFAYIKKTEISTTTPPVTLPVTPESPYAHITRIDAKHFFSNGTHTIVGEILMPTPCDLLNWDTRIQESMPEIATIDFDVINHTETCAQTVTSQRFKVDFTASEKAIIRATLEGRNVEINLIPGGIDETPEDYELFIKG